MRAQALSAVKAGITRLREKGGASPDSLYDLVNGYVTAARTIKMRPGSELDHELPAGETKGLVLFEGKFVVFADHPVEPGNDDYAVGVLRHPDPDVSATLVDIRFAAPFMKYLYVVALWSDGRKIHYWMQSAEEWQANHVYTLYAVVEPTTPNGYTYKAHRATAAGVLWAPEVERDVGDVVEPTTFNGFEYVCIEAYGSPPRSGETEPAWPTATDATVTEEADVDLPGSGDQVVPPPGTPPRYDNPGGSRPGGSNPPTQAQ